MSDLTDQQLAVYASSAGLLVESAEHHKSMAVELQRHRAVANRLEEWAVQLEAKRDQPGDVGHFIAAELRNRMRGAK